jgi:predicted alpha/beta-hydrolase family hydrolase
MQALLADLGEPDARIQRYGFWAQADTPDPDIAPEIEAVAASGADLILAKSIGSLIAMLARREHGLAARAYVFIGAPVKRLSAMGRLDLLAEQAAAAPTLFMQQTADPTGSFAELAAALPASAMVREIAGGDHIYADTGDLAALITAWRSR